MRISQQLGGISRTVQPGSPRPPALPPASDDLPTDSALLSASPTSPEQVVAQRCGQVLSAGRLLVRDDFPFKHTPSLQQGAEPQPTFAGVINFRRLPQAPIYGCSQPTRQAIRDILSHLGAGPNGPGPAVHWTNLREEPVIYVDGSPMWVMDTQHMFTNLEAPGSTVQEVEAREQQLKQDILAEAASSGGKMLLHRVLDGNKTSSEWVEIRPETVQTPREVFDQLRQEGYRADFHRVPVTDEHAPSCAALDLLTQQLGGLPPGTPRVFNCQMGRGRTTTGMVVAQLVEQNEQQGPMALAAGPKIKFDRTFQAISSWLLQVGAGMIPLAGVNLAIQQANAVQNLRDSILSVKKQRAATRDAQESQKLARTEGEYLNRYNQLVAYNTYLQERKPQGRFQDWLQTHPIRSER